MMCIYNFQTFSLDIAKEQKSYRFIIIPSIIFQKSLKNPDRSAPSLRRPVRFFPSPLLKLTQFVISFRHIGRRDPINYQSTPYPFPNFSLFTILIWAGTSPLVPSSSPLQPFFLPILHPLNQNSPQAEKNVNIGRSLPRFSSSFKVHLHQSPHPGFISNFYFFTKPQKP
jgi:hypothetical protein